MGQRLQRHCDEQVETVSWVVFIRSLVAEEIGFVDVVYIMMFLLCLFDCEVSEIIIMMMMMMIVKMKMTLKERNYLRCALLIKLNECVLCQRSGFSILSDLRAEKAFEMQCGQVKDIQDSKIVDTVHSKIYILLRAFSFASRNSALFFIHEIINTLLNDLASLWVYIHRHSVTFCSVCSSHCHRINTITRCRMTNIEEVTVITDHV